jgi:hypothetical protein
MVTVVVIDRRRGHRRVRQPRLDRLSVAATNIGAFANRSRSVMVPPGETFSSRRRSARSRPRAAPRAPRSIASRRSACSECRSVLVALPRPRASVIRDGRQAANQPALAVSFPPGFDAAPPGHAPPSRGLSSAGAGCSTTGTIAVVRRPEAAAIAARDIVSSFRLTPFASLYASAASARAAVISVFRSAPSSLARARGARRRRGSVPRAAGRVQRGLQAQRFGGRFVADPRGLRLRFCAVAMISSRVAARSAAATAARSVRRPVLPIDARGSRDTPRRRTRRSS